VAIPHGVPTIREAITDMAADETKSPDVSVIVVMYRSRDHIEPCLDAIAGSTADLEVIAVDNASPDDSAEILLATHPDARLVRSGDNLGFAGGVNLGAAAATGRYILLLNPDTVVSPGAIDALVAHADQFPDHRIYGGRTVDRTGEVDPRSVWGLPSLWSHISFATGLSTLFHDTRLFDPESLGSWKRDSCREVGAVSGGFLLVDRDLWEQLEGLDEAFFMYGEDIDFALRARAAGARPVLVPGAELFHDAGASSTSADKRVMVMRGKTELAKRRWSGWRLRFARGCLIGGTALRGPGARVASRLLRRSGGQGWNEAWQRRREWQGGWSG